YVWTMAELAAVLGKDAALFARVYGATEAGNFHEPGSSTRGGNILHLSESLAEAATALKMSEADLRARLEADRMNLFAAREKRIHPFKDDKILTDWNGLMIVALAKAARALDEPRYSKAAQDAAD